MTSYLFFQKSARRHDRLARSREERRGKESRSTLRSLRGNQGWPRRVNWVTISSVDISGGESHGHETAGRPAAGGILASAARNVPHPVGARGRGAARLRDHEGCGSAFRGHRPAGAGDALWIAEAAAGGGPRGGKWRARRPGEGRQIGRAHV